MTGDQTRSPAARLAAWMAALAALLSLTLLFGWFEARREHPNRQAMGEVSGGVAELALKQNHAGHYLADGTINGRAVTFMLDTGATSIAIPADLARELNLPRLAPVTVQTANGLTEGWLTRLDEVALGPFREYDLRAVIQPEYEGEVLLGMNFLRTLDWVQRDRTLLLRRYTSENTR